MYDENQIQSGGFDRESGTYHYTYIPRYEPPRPAAPEEPPKRKKSRGGLKIAVLVLCCALVGAVAGVGGAVVYDALTEEDKAPVTVYQNQTDPTPVQVNKADGLTD